MSSPVVVVVDADSSSVRVDSSLVGGMTIREGVVSVGNEHPATVTIVAVITIANEAQITRPK
ncbi:MULTISPECIES: hypothetical protein [Gordonia]|uniref:hypothetical protein n=1 Tax=Gordonia TaxID=2053 RepID=UPI0002F50216|nr:MULTISPECIES: hypothetical protein [Gordonia]MDH3007827.1 hypothetical protein [Gordonia alkanivorans]MDH3020104.1 hypothetical protein [Gordonia alkanivorans]MDH3023671.1 hypothetical protein [Gordonia alkanivorans]MDJ0026493.1 hypothetical protein [Gordonia alkanivorans]WJG12354.1 hypothetical protein PWF70_17395 [Gordonia sp. Swx-4]